MYLAQANTLTPIITLTPTLTLTLNLCACHFFECRLVALFLIGGHMFWRMPLILILTLTLALAVTLTVNLTVNLTLTLALAPTLIQIVCPCQVFACWLVAFVFHCCPHLLTHTVDPDPDTNPNANPSLDLCAQINVDRVSYLVTVNVQRYTNIIRFRNSVSISVSVRVSFRVRVRVRVHKLLGLLYA